MARRKKRRETPEWKWEQSLIDDYYDHCWHKVLDPLYDQFQRWKAGELTHDDMDQAIHRVHKENQETYKLFHQDRGFVITLIQLDRGWFDAWMADNPPPPGIKLTYPLLFPSADDETTA